MSYFSNQFTYWIHDRPTLVVIEFNQISEVNNLDLVVPLAPEEIEVVIKSLNGD